MKIFAQSIHSKKASLSLSVNAIVVLILAITMLGLGLGFMKSMFSKVSGQVEEAISATELTNPATAEKPMTLPAKDIMMTRGETKTFDIGYYNNVGAVKANFTKIECTGSYGTSSVHFSFVAPTPKDVEVNEGDVISILVTANDAAPQETHICTFTIGEINSSNEEFDTVSSNIFIKVR